MSMMYRDGLIPTISQMQQLQMFMGSGLSPALKQYRAYAASIYERIASTDLDWKFASLDVAWDSINLRDFYVQTTSIGAGAMVYDIRDFMRIYPELAQQYLFDRTDQPWHARKLVALVEACYNRGAVVYIPSGFHCPDPLNIQELLGGYRQNVLLEKVVVIVGSNASVVIRDGANPTYSAAACNMRSITYNVGKHASLTVVQDQQRHTDTYDVYNVALYCHESSTTVYTTTCIEALSTKMWLDVIMQGRYAQACVRALYALQGNQTVDIATRQTHQAPHATSDVMVKGVLHDSSQALYAGTIRVEAGASKTDSKQNSHTLLMSGQARAQAIPSLEVLTNDVHCAHGSAVGQFDVQQLLYVQSRGLSSDQAHKILLTGFFADVTTDDGLMQRLVAKV